MKTLLLGVAAATLLHITPTVVMMKREQAVARLLPGAEQFVERDLHLSSGDSKRIHDAVGWEPPDGVLTFYVGKRQEQATGALLFMRVDCQHGPLELAIGYDPRGAVLGVEVTKATVEMKPWVLEALRAGLTDSYRGISADQMPAGAEKVKSHIGSMPGYMAELIDKGVMHANAAYRLFYR